MSFPLNSNQAYIKDTGERTTLGRVIGSGGGGSSELPEYSIADAGKVLTVDAEGELTWDTVTSGVNRYAAPATNTPSMSITTSEGGTT